MQIVIDINEDVFTRLFDNGTEDYAIVNDDLFAIAKTIRKGKVLPEHHGRLIDEEDITLIDEQFYVPSDYYVAESAINDAPTIIEGSDSE